MKRMVKLAVAVAFLAFSLVSSRASADPRFCIDRCSADFPCNMPCYDDTGHGTTCGAYGAECNPNL